MNDLTYQYHIDYQRVAYLNANLNPNCLPSMTKTKRTLI